jgi:hypothetical protein
MKVTEKCPHCEADLKGDPILEADRDHYGGKTHYSLVIGIQYDYNSPQHYDGISEWMCPFCGYREGRWTGRELKDGELEPRYGGK